VPGECTIRVAFPGLSINNFSNLTNAGIVFFPLDDFEQADPRAH